MVLSDGIRLGHVNIEVTSLARARRFYDRFLPVLGFTSVRPSDPAWLGYRKGRVAVWITVSHPKRVTRQSPHVPTDGVEDPISDHIGFRAPSAKRVADVEAALLRRGFQPVYLTDKQPTHGPAWYTSNAWKDPDNNVLEIYAVTKR
jgi:catechol 2,3-dioxygenase-like lactoylglutathione lyase family enzyme